MKNLITVYSRHGCHLCEVAEATLETLKIELDFNLEIKFIDGDAELEKLAMANPEIAAAISGAKISKVITRAPKLVNIVL